MCQVWEMDIGQHPHQKFLVILKMLTYNSCYKSNAVVIDQCIILKSFCNIFAQLLFQMEIVFFTYFCPKFNELYVLLHKQLERYWSEANPYFSITIDIQHNTECPHTWASNIVLKRCSSISSFMVIVEDFYQWTFWIYLQAIALYLRVIGKSRSCSLACCCCCCCCSYFYIRCEVECELLVWLSSIQKEPR